MMDDYLEVKQHRLEESHWWFKARRDMIMRLLKAENVDKGSKILDAGCSGGLLLDSLIRSGFTNVWGVDISQRAISLCRRRGLEHVLLRDITGSGLDDAQFNCVIASDIIEHIENDDAAVGEIARILKPGGILIIFVPAFDFLWGPHDEAYGHYRRYTKHMLLSLLEKSGFAVERCSYWNFTLFWPGSLLRLSYRLLPKATKRDQLYELNDLLNCAITRVLEFENKLLEKHDLPIGVSIFAIAKRI